MSLEDRARQFEALQQQRRQQGSVGYGAGGGNDASLQAVPSITTAAMFPQTRFGIVDGKVVEVHAQDDIPGMSPAVWCSDIVTGAYAPVPTSQVRHFATAGQAYQALQNQQTALAPPQNESYRR